jgi:hypothetical protein
VTGEGEEARADIDIEGNVGVWRGVKESEWVGGWVFAAAARTLTLLYSRGHDITRAGRRKAAATAR